MSTLIENITGIQINSVHFCNSPLFELFPPLTAPKKNRVVLLYGKNGSGKSSIAQGFREYRDCVNPRTITITPSCLNATLYQSPDGRTEKIFIFDEEYIKRSVAIKDNGLDAIVLLGKQVELEAEIERISGEINIFKGQQQHQESECAKFNNTNNVISPSYWNAKIETILKKSGGWAEISSRIKGNRKNDSVTKDVIEKIGKLQPAKSASELHVDFIKQFELFQRANQQNQILPQKINIIPFVESIERETTELLQKSIQRPVLTDRENEILRLFGIDGVRNAQEFLSDISKVVCRTCFQPISDVYRAEILTKIESILNRDIEEIKTHLQKLLLTEIKSDEYQIYNSLNAQTLNTLTLAITIYNRSVSAHNNMIRKKIDNPFDVIEYDPEIGVIAANEALNDVLTTLEAERISYNENITKRPSAQTTLQGLNDEIAHYAFKDEYTSFVNQTEAKKTATSQLNATKEKISDLETEKTRLDSQRQNFEIAIKEINRSLEYIFFTKRRLELILGEDQLYHLKSNGNPVDPNKISCGERNALALCYFFTDIAKNMEASSIYSDEVLLIIDDPVSSFDFENKIGILSFMRWKFEQVLDGCATSKIILMSHDVSTIFDLGKALEEISVYCESQGKSSKYSVLELDKNAVSDFRYQRRNDYTSLLERIFDYAKDGNVENDLIVGNSMRRIMEAFSTFSYKKGIDKISCDENILASIIDIRKREHFKNLMYRLVLNGESHYEEHMRGLQDMNFFGYLSDIEKQRTAQEVLCFMYLLNKNHVLAHLSERPAAEQTIGGWCSSIGNPNAY